MATHSQAVPYDHNRMLNKTSSIVLASLKGSTYEKEYVSPFRSLWPCLWKGASRRVGVGRVKTAGLLSILGLPVH